VCNSFQNSSYKVRIFYFLILLSWISYSTNKIDVEKYEIAYNHITEKSKNSKPFLEEFGSDASGTKIIAKIYKYKGYYQNFITQKNFEKQKELKKLANKYSKKNWRKDNAHKILMPEEVKDFHGPLNYIYFTEIKNDTLKAQILGNPFGKYEMTAGQNFIIVFENKKIKFVKEWNSYYD